MYNAPKDRRRKVVEAVKNILWWINVVKGLENPRFSMDYENRYLLIKDKINRFKGHDEERILVEYIKKNIKSLDVEDMGVVVLQCPELIPDLVNENNLNAESITEICTALQTNDPERLELILKGVDYEKKMRFIQKAQKTNFEEMYILKKSTEEDRLKAAVKVPKAAIIQYFRRNAERVGGQAALIESIENPDKFFIKEFLDWHKKKGTLQKGYDDLQHFFVENIQKVLDCMEEEKAIKESTGVNQPIEAPLSEEQIPEKPVSPAVIALASEYSKTA